MSTDESTAKAHATDPITIGGRTYPREPFGHARRQARQPAERRSRDVPRIAIGTYRGLRFGIVLNSRFAPDVYLEGATIRQTSLSREHQGPRAVLNALEQLAAGYSTDCDQVHQDLTIAESQHCDYQARLGNPFTLEVYRSELTKLRDQLSLGFLPRLTIQAKWLVRAFRNWPKASRRSRPGTASTLNNRA